MKTRVIPVRVDLDITTEQAMGTWADQEGRSKRRHIAILARRLAELRDQKPDELRKLGLMQQAGS
jgi:hypothetical protein